MINNTRSPINYKIKTMLDLIVCEVCSISAALIINCIVFFDCFAVIAAPVVFIVALIAVSIASITVRKIYISKHTLKNYE